MQRTKYISLITTLFSVFLLFFSAVDAYGQLTITERTPSPHSTDAVGSDPIEIEFSQDIDFSTVESSIFIHSSLSGSIPVEFSQEESNSISVTPTSGFSPGEKVYVTITSNLLSENGTPLAETQQWLFTVQPELGIDNFLIREYQLSEGSEPSAIQAVDINNNLLPDLVVINSNNSKVTILENKLHITGDFLVREPIETGVDQEAAKGISAEDNNLLAATLPPNSSITSADLNKNGYTDLIVTATLSNQLILLQNSSDGQANFNIELIETGERPVEVVAADINNNGFQDLVVAGAGTDEILVHYNNGDGTFEEPQSIGVGFVPLSIEVDDISNTGFMDIVVALSGENRVIGLLNDGNGSFSTEILIDELSFTPTFFLTDNLIISDNGDQFSDIALGSSDETEIFLYQNNGDSFSFYNSLSSGQLARPLAGVTSDITANGALDLISSHFASNNLLINLNTLNGFSSQGIVNEIPGPVGIASSDFSYSGSMDFAVVNQSTEQVTLLYNTDTRPSSIVSSDLSFGEVCIGEDSTKTLGITNVSSNPVVVNVSIDNDTFTAEVDSFEIDAKSTFSLPITFAPNTRGDFQATITFEYVRKGGVFRNVIEYELFGRSVESELELPNLVNFGELQVGATDNQTFEILNTGNIDAVINLAISGNTNIFNVENPVNFTLGPNNRANIVITFTPEAFQDYEDELIVTVTSDCGTLEYIVELTGSGVDPQTELALPEAIDFGDVEINLTETEEFQIQNSGNVDITLDMMFEDNQNGVFTISGPQSFSLPPDSIQTIPLIFSPVNTINYSTELKISGSSDFDDVEYIVPIRGTGIEPLPDLVAVQISVESISGDYLLGQAYHFDASFRLDREEVVSDPFDLIFLVNGEEQQRTRFNETLNPGDSRSISFEHAFSSEGENTVQFVVDPEDEIDESTTENNSVSTVIQIRRGNLVISPNPFTPNNDGYNDQVDFDFSQLGTASNPTVKIFSFNGRLVQSLQTLNSGSILWDGRDSSGNTLSPGVYLYVIEENNQLLGRGSITLAL